MTLSQKEIEEIIRDKMRQRYSETVIEHSLNPKNLGTIKDADGLSVVTGHHGDTMKIYLKVNEDIIDDAKFFSDGCSNTVASGSMITEMAKGESISEACKISQQDVLIALNGLPDESKHCVDLAVHALKEALRDILVMKKEPWKCAYRIYQ